LLDELTGNVDEEDEQETDPQKAEKVEKAA